ncbi:MAG: bifunctional oligoribonuclease/PAP phosphatase NrnA [bacterium]
MEIIKKVIKLINSSKSVAILSHVSPDGDTLGSMLALYEALKNIPSIKKLDAVKVGRTPDIYKYLPFINETKSPSDDALYQSYDLVIAIDCGALDRLSESSELFKKAKTSINIDHHISNPMFGDINWIEPKATATGIIIYKLLKEMNIEITQDIAICLYTAIMTDSGGFKFENINPEGFNICAKLLEYGARPDVIYKQCYESIPLPMVMLKARAINEAIFTKDNKIAYSIITRKMLEEVGATDDHVEGISEELRQIDSIKVSMVFKETPKGDTKVSFRSNGPDVCEIARFFGGGGHKLAAGCTIQKKPDDAANEIMPIIKKQINK